MTSNTRSYAEAIAEFGNTIEGSTAVPLEVPASVYAIEPKVYERARVVEEGLVFVELDRALLTELGITPDGPAGSLYTHLWPVVLRFDADGDLVLHVTTAERAQGEA